MPRARTSLLAGGVAGGVLLWGYTPAMPRDDALPLAYDPAAIAAVWSQRPVAVTQRVCAIAAEVLPFVSRLGLHQLWLRLPRPVAGRDGDGDGAGAGDGAGRIMPEGDRQRYAVELREMLTRLGPLFIKLGQMLSIRPDIMPPAAIYELQKLCDAVPAFPAADALRVIEDELGPVGEHFDGLALDTTPIAAASLGQVYKVVLRATGEEVAVKVQRPDMLASISLDLFLLRKYSTMVEWCKAYVTVQKPYDVQLVDTFGGATYQELDYCNEARNQQFFARALADTVPEVRVPAVHWGSSSRKVLCSEWINGVQLAKSSPAVINTLTPVGVKCFLAQLLDIGYFHSDPHPGNLLVDQDGRLTLIDFGLCAKVDKPAKASMTKALIHLMAVDVEALMHDAVDLGFLHASVDTTELLPILQHLFKEASIAADAVGAGNPEHSTAKRRKQFHAVSDELNQIFFEFPFQVPDYFALVTRALIVLEGIALTGDPQFDLFQSSYPYAASRAVDLLGRDGVSALILEAASQHLLTENQRRATAPYMYSATGAHVPSGWLDSVLWRPRMWWQIFADLLCALVPTAVK